MLGYSQTGNFALTRFATLAGVYGLSFEIVLVNSVFAAAFLVAPEEAGAKQRRKWMLVAAALIPQRITRSLPATSSGWQAGVSPITAFQPASLAGEQMVRSRREAPMASRKPAA